MSLPKALPILTADQARDVMSSAEARDLVRLAYLAVDQRLDAGDGFEELCRLSSVFHRAVDEARLLRAYYPGVLRDSVKDSSWPPS